MERKLLRKEGFKAKKLWRAALFASTGLSAVLSLPAMARAQTLESELENERIGIERDRGEGVRE